MPPLPPEYQEVLKEQLPGVLKRIESGMTTEADVDWVEDLAGVVLEAN